MLYNNVLINAFCATLTMVPWNHHGCMCVLCYCSTCFHLVRNFPIFSNIHEDDPRSDTKNTNIQDHMYKKYRSLCEMHSESFPSILSFHFNLWNLNFLLCPEGRCVDESRWRCMSQMECWLDADLQWGIFMRRRKGSEERSRAAVVGTNEKPDSHCFCCNWWKCTH